MGFGSVIATGLCVVLLIATGYVISSGLMHAADTTAASVKASDDLKNRQLKTALVIDSAAGFQAGNLSFSLANVGSEKIANVSQIDVILKLNDPGNGTGDAYWVPHQRPGQTTGTYWRAGNISSLAGDCINPGMLDPGESVAIEVLSDAAFDVPVGTIIVAAPDGVSTSANFILT